MRIAMISDCYLPRLGGIETLVRDLSHQLQAAGHQVLVFTATPDRDAVSPAEPFVVRRLTARLPGELPVVPRARARLRRELAAARPDVVHVHAGVVSPFAWSGIAAAQELGLPVVITWHCTLGPVGAWVGARWGAPRRWQERGAVLSAVSRYAAGWVERAGGHQVRVVPNGITVAHWQPAARAPRQGRPVRCVAAIRLVRAKRPQVLVAQFARAVAAVPQVEAELVLCGSGPRRRALQQQIARAGIAHRVRLAGRVTREELAALYRQSDVYLSARLDEAFGIAPLEARTAGLAVVGRAGTGMDDFITPGRNGLLANSDDELGERLAWLLANPGELAAITAHNATTPPTEDWPTVVETVVAAYAAAQGAASGGGLLQ
ncbi:glycosyltransferase family 4 protein [Buchananella hordeovulneris]|uniref:glycosyltransferase family 4 protein n=1 Tax=Buchananella hordeovulneris TaxID=52770 RepID=UPI000F5D9142|nr:glycosyltransferase family 4 protein [Buchananella hordeovulneris]RRD45016.1 glycosyltransferase family 1 protein [Buchananella hordeovulneris]